VVKVGWIRLLMHSLKRLWSTVKTAFDGSALPDSGK
jgi:hypothetical protein